MNALRPYNFSPTIIGVLGLFIWSLSALFTVYLDNIPTFQIITIIFFVSTVTSFLSTTANGNWSNLAKHPPFLWIIGIVGICGNEILYITSFKLAPPAGVDLITYLWPLMVILFSSLLPKERFSKSHLCSGLIAFYAVYLLLSPDLFNHQHNTNHIMGYTCAFGAAVLWAGYTLLSRAYARPAPELIGIYYSFGFIFSLGLHLQSEYWISPSLVEWVVLISMGALSHGLAYAFWDTGVKKGNFKLLSIMSYGTPIASIFFLVLFGFAEMTPSLGIAATLFFIASLIGSAPNKKDTKTQSTIA
ncbi:MAG: EamA family transporter [Chlamydiota bacterium]|nr:EamA family transporter [Chlamydiota bacterium]